MMFEYPDSQTADSAHGFRLGALNQSQTSGLSWALDYKWLFSKHFTFARGMLFKSRAHVSSPDCMAENDSTFDESLHGILARKIFREYYVQKYC